MKRFFNQLDPFLLIPSLGLAGISIFILASVGTNEFLAQSVFIIFGLLIYLIISTINYRIWSRFSVVFYLLTVFLLLILFFLPQIRGVHRWIDFGLFLLQPSEILKPILIVVFAYLISKRDLSRTGNLFFINCLFLPILILVFLQPDLGNTIVYAVFFLGMLLAGGISLSLVISGSILFTILTPAFWTFLKSYQKQRILSFFNPAIDPAGSGYNAIQSMIAVGSGGLWGLGLGRGTQSKLFFLPEFQTDFIFATLVESLGFIGGIVLIFLYFFLLVRILSIVFSAEDQMGKLISIGIFLQIFIQVFINIGMNLGILPITGITLPLVSSGGSSIISTFLSLGILNAIGKSRRENELVIR
ncbi:hypothetical protein A3J20_06730 [Candidatus Gottesmanbacteria bacterium RIFCSPLOWO2_02_FULL_42_29]|uniref:Rod shape-determining protein RodA n=2 Tax=Candidatus Gottesmaniibacteriota TaxID=1752720 RepID=A0A1F6BKF5_9BACT|nr:MAG: Rod shape-determining protein RodA [Candidatus Gottesmanbacteria bacterium GW2011_GWA2_42_18]OGG10882.1 MAG: hypothetical protein A2781_06295 [Candidatus Gottesmanbacteria bacterium RIFCSPHIGHO2_01_FULL_42_27]OGG19942.1 MAG: hypothetical protein A3E72_04960 [Candidatus Gottesmanbacteria bacterium RIFCSPHIGHO2_12_FULL_43_26]OGG33564.1 MAG: hypothetical protein A3G68_06060 [Candidatus Gottesmanbacteria bacterium RIFCSPLOWO2_12_FULL_42_10]OGG36638.1 MAG: hypothetical protein A3J20_06730 [C